jgi:glycerol-3-phosphate dehydrogenase
MTLAGGKYTTYRKMAEKVVDRVVKKLHSVKKFKPCTTKETPLYGGEATYTHLDETRYLLTPSQIERLISIYGSKYTKLIQLIQDNPHEAVQFCTKHPHLIAEVTYAIKVEKALSLDDWFMRRSTIAYTPCQGIDCLKTVSAHFAHLLKWDEKKLKTEIRNYIAQIL